MSVDVTACCGALTLTEPQLCDVRDALCQRIQEGLNCEGAEIQALPAYLPLPKKDLSGTALVIDIGGTNMRAALIEFQNGKASIKAGPVQGQVATGRDYPVSAQDFFRSQAELAAQLNPPAGTPVGYCFSYPARITPDVDARLLAWTKGINIPDVVGTSVGAGLRRALKDQGLQPGRLIVLNDTVATLLAGTGTFASEFDQFIGLIAGTGINMAGFLPSAQVGKLDPNAYRAEKIAINLESGNFKPPFATRWDDLLDEASDNPGRQRFEKACSGYYVPFLYQTIAKDIGLDIGNFDPTWGTGHLVKLALEHNDELAMAILKRSGRLIAATIAGFMKAMGGGRFAVVAEGSRYWKDPTQAPLIYDLVGVLCRPDQEFNISAVENANFIGSACAVLGLE